MTTAKRNRKEYRNYLNEIGVPDHDHPDNGGRVSKNMLEHYGYWLEENDPIAFNIGLNEYIKGKNNE